MSLLEAFEVIATAINASPNATAAKEMMYQLEYMKQELITPQPVVSKKKVSIVGKKQKTSDTPTIVESVATHVKQDGTIAYETKPEAPTIDDSPQDETVLEQQEEPLQPTTTTAMSPMDYDKMLEHFHALQELLQDRAPHLVELLEDIKIEASSL